MTQFNKITVTSASQPKSYTDRKTKSGNPIDRCGGPGCVRVPYKGGDRFFCGACGSSLYSKPVGDGVFVKIGSLREAQEFKPVIQIFEENALPGLLAKCVGLPCGEVCAYTIPA